ncbi:hypothetical protein RB625_19770 [Streptomyces californicus]|uniref:hypothetical protein n=1 Tax=Streptomyces californicus TaxID=67351 RepID=UPI00296FDE54|nr:hypothetical protein [Streptomyces californicus]MDW4900651.1 hypothetical protein [Streptomyces californicus]
MPSTADKVIAYYTELQRSILPTEVVEDIVKDAAQTLVVNNGLTTRRPPTHDRIVICAGSTAQAKRWADINGFSPSNVILAEDTSSLHGLHGFAVVTLPGFHGRTDAQLITDALIAMQGAHEDFVEQCANQDIIGTTPSL